MSAFSKSRSASRTGAAALAACLLALAVAALASERGAPAATGSLPPLRIVPSAPERPDLDPLYRRYGVPGGECNRSAIGAVAGGLLGGVIGDRISEGREGGVIAGSLVGALLGNLIGRGLDAASARCGGAPPRPAPQTPSRDLREPTIQV